MLGDELLSEERPERMAEEDDRNARLLLGDQPIHGPEVADDLAPSPVVGEMAEVRGGGLGPVATMIAGEDRIAGGVERRGEARVTGAVLGETMGDLHHRPRRSLRQPAAGQKAQPIVGPKPELPLRHRLPCPHETRLRKPALYVKLAARARRVKRPRRGRETTHPSKSKLPNAEIVVLLGLDRPKSICRAQLGGIGKSGLLDRGLPTALMGKR